MDYCLGFAFDEDGRVLLLYKQKPAWQAGKLNGLGGKIEADETPLAAMNREWDEEANHGLTRGRVMLKWRHFATMQVSRGFSVYCFCAPIAVQAMSRCRNRLTDAGEVLVPRDAHDLSGTIPNLSWLIPLALEPDLTGVAIIPLEAT